MLYIVTNQFQIRSYYHIGKLNYDKENFEEAGKQFELFLISMKKGSEILKSTRDLTPGMLDFIDDIFQQVKYLLFHKKKLQQYY